MTKCNTTLPVACPSPSNWADCRPWELTKSRDQCFIENQLTQAVQIAGADINVHKLLGIHEQRSLLDVTGLGKPVSGGDHPAHPSSNAFNTLNTSWISIQSGDDVVARSFIGYDFGNVKIASGRETYAVPAAVRYNISTLRIKQGDNVANRVTKARVERSDNGVEWYGVSIVNLPNDGNLNTVYFKQSVPSKFWRIRPLNFGGVSCESWVIKALEFHEYASTDVSNIEDRILFENRNRDYQENYVRLKGYYELISPLTLLERFGQSITSTTYTIKIPFSTSVAALGRPVVIGDIFELPSEVQYTPTLQPVKRYVEVTDVTWDATSYTPGWQPTTLLITAQPALASQETRDIFGDLTKRVDSSGLFDKEDGNATTYQDFSAISHTITNQALTEVPERGSEGSNTIREFTPEEISQAAPIANLNKLNFNRGQLYVEDAIPQNGERYTEGADFPATPTDKQYHRIVYEGAARDVPARLYRWSAVKNRWIYLESDRRQQYNSTTPILQEYLASNTGTPAREIK